MLWMLIQECSAGDLMWRPSRGTARLSLDGSTGVSPLHRIQDVGARHAVTEESSQ